MRLLLFLFLSPHSSVGFQGRFAHSLAKQCKLRTKDSFPHLKTATVDVSGGQSGNNEDIGSIKKQLTKEFFSIGIPAFVQLAAEPLAALVDTAYLGRLGPEVSNFGISSTRNKGAGT